MKRLLVIFSGLCVMCNAYAGDNEPRGKLDMNNDNKIVQTAGRDNLGSFAPEFAHFNDDVLFGENWNNHDISLKTRALITVVSLQSQGITDSSLKFHLINAKKAGISREEIVAAITHTAFYSGWPKAWAVFNLAKDVWSDAPVASNDKEKYAQTIIFPIGEPNNAYAKYFKGHTFSSKFKFIMFKNNPKIDHFKHYQGWNKSVMS